MPSTADAAIAAALREKHAEIRGRQAAVADDMAELRRRWDELETDLRACHEAARLFRVNLTEEPSPPDFGLFDHDDKGGDAKPLVRDIVREELRRAYPNPVKAAEVRKVLSDRGIDAHEKTVGMTLYRLLKRGTARREGIRWFYVPDEERRSTEGADHAPEQGMSAPSAPSSNEAPAAPGGGI